MDRTVSFFVAGEPKGKARPRVLKSGRAYTPKATAEYESAVKFAYLLNVGDTRFNPPIKVAIDAYFGVPKSATKRKREQMLRGDIPVTKRPDCDNIAKIICDALNGAAYTDDAQITDLTVKKHYAETARVEITISGDTEGEKEP